MDLSSMTTYVAALSVSTGRVTESVKRFPEFLGVFFVDPQTGTAEDVRMICVHVLAVMIGGGKRKRANPKPRHDEDHVKRAVGIGREGAREAVKRRIPRSI